MVVKLTSRDQLLQFLDTQSNDLEGSAIALAPVIADVLSALRELAGCKLARMSGSGATCFGLFSAVDRGATRFENSSQQTSGLVGERPAGGLVRPRDTEIDGLGERRFHL